MKSRINPALFAAFSGDPSLLPGDVTRKIEIGADAGVSTERIIADYIAGMTDRYAITEYDRINNPHSISF